MDFFKQIQPFTDNDTVLRMQVRQHPKGLEVVYYPADTNTKGPALNPLRMVGSAEELDANFFTQVGQLGQVVLGTVGRVEQVKYDKNRNETIHTLEQRQSRAYKLPNVVELLPDIKKIKSKDTGPSCSLLQALNRQDLFINSTLANLGLALLWRLFREGRTDYQGAYLNLKTMQANAIKVKHTI